MNRYKHLFCLFPLDAIVSEGETLYDNICHLRWDKKIKYQDIK